MYEMILSFLLVLQSSAHLARWQMTWPYRWTWHQTRKLTSLLVQNSHDDDNITSSTTMDDSTTSGWVVVAGCRSIPPDSFQTLGLYLLLTELGSSSGRTVGLTLFGMGAKRPPRGKSRAPRWKEHRANPPKLIGICIKKYHHYTIVSKLLFKKISSIFSKTMLYRFTTAYSTSLAKIFVYAYFTKVVEAWR